MAEEIHGKTVVINQPSYAIYNAFSDLRNLVAAIPEDKKEKVVAEADSITVNVQGFDLGMRVRHKEPFHKIEFEQFGKSPFPFLITMNMDPSDDVTTFFHIDLVTELPGMIKFMIGNKLQGFVDKITEQIAAAAAGNLPKDFNPADFKPENFNFNN